MYIMGITLILISIIVITFGREMSFASESLQTLHEKNLQVTRVASWSLITATLQHYSPTPLGTHLVGKGETMLNAP